MKPLAAHLWTEPQRPRTKQSHHRRMVSEYTNLTVERGRYDGIDFTFEQNPLWGDNGDVQHA